MTHSLSQKTWPDVADRAIVILKQDLVTIDKGFPIDQVMPRSELEKIIPVEYPEGLKLTFRKDRMILTAPGYHSIPVLSSIEENLYAINERVIGDSRDHEDDITVEGGRRITDL